jgi:RHS repeat-associated protein
MTFSLYSQTGLPLEPAPALSGNDNQLSSISFDFSGMAIGKSRSFYNSLSKPTQSQSWDILTDKIWASQVLYDRHGRGSFQTLSAPIGHNFGYSSNFILNDLNNSYTFADFDIDIDNPSVVGNQSHLQRYYSSSNTANFYQDITAYPFSRTVFSRLNPGSTLMVLGGNKINGQWKQSYSFTMPAGTELSATHAYGSSFETDTRVTKYVSRDVHGVDVVVFTDADGNTLAAARSGNEQGTQGLSTNTLSIGTQGYIDIHIPKGVVGFTVSNPDITASGHLKIFDLMTETELTPPITTAFANRSVPSGFYRIAVSNPFDYAQSQSGAITVTHQVNYYDYSLNYYDKAQRLVRSQQPLNHLESTFTYNSLGQLMHTTSPDEGTAKFLYRKDGQIRFSQNSKQEALGEVSYTNYDDKGRPIESGVFTTLSSFDSLASSVDNTALPSGATNFKDTHYTEYDLPDSKLETELKACGLPVEYYKQTFVAGNVSKSYTKNPETTTSWYSYDVFGRLRWMIQKIPGLDCLKTIDYVYNPEKGQVVEVDYQRHDKFERFLHTYEYTRAGQLEYVYTSTDGVDKIRQAEYRYDDSGALKRTILAENLQGIDYVYNLSGQLKAINHPSLTVSNDPGGDGGSNGVIADVFGLSIDYYNGDYTRPGTPTPVAQQSTYGTNQYNGNIKGVHFNTQGFEPSSNSFNTYTYSYDKNNWLGSANFGSGSIASIGGGMHQVNFTPDSNNDYGVSNISYDANGNIQTLERNGFSTGPSTNNMDDFTYHYDGTNKLQYVEDTGDNANVQLFDDLKNQTNNGNPNYHYNAIGQLTVDVEGKALYQYNTAGLVTRVNTFGQAGQTGTEHYQLYAQDFEYADDSEAQLWSVDTGVATINYSGDYDTCASLETLYGISLELQLNGNRKASRYFDVVPNATHTLDLDIIADQSRKAGYKITVYDEQNVVLASTNYNLALDNIVDPDHPGCGKFYDRSETLTFTATTDKVRFEIQMFTETPLVTSYLYLDNIEIHLNVIPKLAFYYNDKGHRVKKEVYQYGMADTEKTFYVRDASGSPMAIYNIGAGRPSPAAQIPDEHPIYGASRLGVFYRDQDDTDKGDYVYELTDHLGNVRAVLMKDGTNALSITNQTDYYPFGMPMPKRNIEDGEYRYKYQGQEKDPETGMEAFELRLWDSRIGRWLNPDPVKQFHSPYLGIGNDPIKYVDKKGDSVWVYSERIKATGYLARHIFLRIKTLDIDVTIELTGIEKDYDFDQDGKKEKFAGRTGIPVIKQFDEKYFKNGRGPVNGPVLVGNSEDGSLELKILDEFFEFTYREKDENGIYDFPNLPDYVPKGPNSNGFIQFLLNQVNIGIKSTNPTVLHPGIGNTQPYKKIVSPRDFKSN